MVSNLLENHFYETKKLAKSLSKQEIGDWLLKFGYYPENYLLPPCFKVSNFIYNDKPYFKFTADKFKTIIDQPINISFPKSLLTVRTYGIVNPRIYHDLIFHLVNNWDYLLDILFNENLKIFSYSFPLPVVKNKVNHLSDIRSGRLIYEFIEMAENDLVSEAHKYSYIIKTDIANFYPSIYTHSVSWAIHTKEYIRKDANRNNYLLFGNCIDKLLQSTNDGCTNGLPIGSALSDLISEILLASVDLKISNELQQSKIQFKAVRFKDDYRFLCNNKKDASDILRILQQNLFNVNLSLNENKTSINELPEGLYRSWTSEYRKVSLKYKRFIRFKTFEETLLSVLEIDKRYPGTGLIDKFLSELTTNKGKLKILQNRKQKRKFISLLLLLKNRRPKAFPKILSIIELVYNNERNAEIIEIIQNNILELFQYKIQSPDEEEYELIWLWYFCCKVLGIDLKIKNKFENKFIESIRINKQAFYLNDQEINLYTDYTTIENNIFHYLKIF